VKNVDSFTFSLILLSLLPFEKQSQGVVRGDNRREVGRGGLEGG
jgi:hypothetical protein